MATHSSILALNIPWTEESGQLQSIGSQSQTGLKRLGMCACKKSMVAAQQEGPRISTFQIWKLTFTPCQSAKA